MIKIILHRRLLLGFHDISAVAYFLGHPAHTVAIAAKMGGVSFRGLRPAQSFQSHHSRLSITAAAVLRGSRDQQVPDVWRRRHGNDVTTDFRWLYRTAPTSGLRRPRDDRPMKRSEMTATVMMMFSSPAGDGVHSATFCPRRRQYLNARTQSGGSDSSWAEVQRQRRVVKTVQQHCLV